MSRGDIEGAYREHGHHVLRRALRLLGDRAEAEEVLHDVFVSLLDRPAQYGGRSSLVTWLYAATTHRCLNRLRDGKSRVKLEEANPAALPCPSPPAKLDVVVALRRLLVSLPGELAEVAVYYYGDEMTHEEIAGVLGCSRRHVGDLLVKIGRLVAQEEGGA